MDNRTLGMIPGLQPPEGVPETPKGFARLPTQAELHTAVKSWFGDRSDSFKETTASTCTSVSSLMKFTLTDEERQEFAEVHKQLQLSELNPEESVLLGTVYTHPETGLVFGTDSANTYHEGIGCPSFPSPRVAFFKEMFVVGINFDAVVRYYVKDPVDIPRLLEIVKEGSSDAFVAISLNSAKEMLEGASHD